MERDGDVLPGEVAAAPRAPPLPLARAGVGGAERAQQRDGEVLGQRVPHEPAASILGTTAPPQRVGAQDSAASGGRPLRRQL